MLNYTSLRGLFYRPWQSFIILLVFVVNTLGPIPTAQADEFLLPAPGVMVRLSPEFNPPILKGLKVHPNNPFRFDFILDQGDSVIASEARQSFIKEESTKLIKYFLASLTIPEKDLWVNLSPYEKNRIVPQSFGLTEMGRDLLAEDYMLKQITASLIYPEDEIGKKFWKRIYEEADKKFGTTNIPVNTFNKVWIVPEKAVVYENAKAGTAYVVEAKLKVMLEEDYLSLSHNVIPAQAGIHNKNDINALGSQIVREIVIPELTKEVNCGRNFAQLRQVYNSLILAAWYKKKIKDSILVQVYDDRNKIQGLVIPAKAGIHNKNDVEHIYQQYLKAFKKGVYNYIKEDQDPLTQQTIPRKYFSGGLRMVVNIQTMRDLPSFAMLHSNDGYRVTMDLAMTTTPDTRSLVHRVQTADVYPDMERTNFMFKYGLKFERADPKEISNMQNMIKNPLTVKIDIYRRQAAVGQLIHLGTTGRRELDGLHAAARSWSHAHAWLTGKDSEHPQGMLVSLINTGKVSVEKWQQEAQRVHKKQQEEMLRRKGNEKEKEPPPEETAYLALEAVYNFSSLFDGLIKRLEGFNDPLLREMAEELNSLRQGFSSPEGFLDIVRRNDQEQLAAIHQKADVIAGNLLDLGALLCFADYAQERKYAQVSFEEGQPVYYEQGELFTDTDENQTKNGSPEDSLVTVLTGSNMSGKSHYLEQNFYIQLLGQAFGWAPVQKGNLRIYKYIAYLDRPQGEYDLSSWGKEVTNWLLPEHRIGQDAIFFVDEGFSTTSPEDQAKFLKALNSLHQLAMSRGVRLMLATHNEEYISVSGKDRQKVKLYHLGVEVKKDKIKFTYKLKRGRADSNAFVVAQVLNFPKRVLDRAKRYARGQAQPVNNIARKELIPIQAYSPAEREAEKNKKGGFLGFFPNDSVLQIVPAKDSWDRGGIGWRYLFKEYNTVGKPWSRLNSHDSKEIFQHDPVFNVWSQDPDFDEDSSPMARQVDYGKLTGQKHHSYPMQRIHRLLMEASARDPKEILERQRMFAALKGLESTDFISRPLEKVEDFMRALAPYEGEETYDDARFNLRFLESSAEIFKHISHRSTTKDLKEAVEFYLGVLRMNLRLAGQTEKGLGVEEEISKIKEVLSLQEKLDTLEQGSPRHSGVEFEDEVYQKWYKDIYEPNFDRILERLSELKGASLEFFETKITDNTELIEQFIQSINTKVMAQVPAFSVYDPKVWDILRQEVNNLYPYAYEQIQAYYGGDAFRGIVRLKSLLSEEDVVRQLLDAMRTVDSVHMHQWSNYFEEILKYSLGAVRTGMDYVRQSEENRKKIREQAYWNYHNFDEFEKLQTILNIAYVIKYQDWQPVELTDKMQIDIKGAWNLNRNKQEQVPLNMKMGDNELLRIYSGSTMSGKTFAEKTLIWLSLAGMATGFVPAQRAKLPVFAHVLYLDRIAEKQFRHLSSFGQEITNENEFLEKAAVPGVVLAVADEIGSTTSPRYQEAWSYGISEEMLEAGNFMVLSSHNHQFIEAFSRNNKERVGVYNFKTTVDKQANVVFKHKIQRGHEASNSLRVAKTLGLKRLTEMVEQDNAMLTTSRQKGIAFPKRPSGVENKIWNLVPNIIMVHMIDSPKLLDGLEKIVPRFKKQFILTSPQFPKPAFLGKIFSIGSSWGEFSPKFYENSVFVGGHMMDCLGKSVADFSKAAFKAGRRKVTVYLLAPYVWTNWSDNTLEGFLRDMDSKGESVKMLNPWTFFYKKSYLDIIFRKLLTDNRVGQLAYLDKEFLNSSTVKVRVNGEEKVIYSQGTTHTLIIDIVRANDPRLKMDNSMLTAGQKKYIDGGFEKEIGVPWDGKYGLSKWAKSVIEDLEPAELQAIAQAAGPKAAKQVFKFGFDTLKIEKVFTAKDKGYGPGLVAMAEAVKDKTGFLLEVELPGAKRVVGAQFMGYWPGLVRIVQAVGPNAVNIEPYDGDLGKKLFLKNVLITLKETFKDESKDEIENEREFREHWWPELVEMAEALGPDAGDVLLYALPTVKGVLGKDFKGYYWPGLIIMAQAAKAHTVLLFKLTLPPLKRLYGKNFKEYWPVLVEIARDAGPLVKYVFRGLQLEGVKSLVYDKESLKEIGGTVLDILHKAQERGGDLEVVFPSLAKVKEDPQTHEVVDPDHIFLPEQISLINRNLANHYHENAAMVSKSKAFSDRAMTKVVNGHGQEDPLVVEEKIKKFNNDFIKWENVWDEMHRQWLHGGVLIDFWLGKIMRDHLNFRDYSPEDLGGGGRSSPIPSNKGVIMWYASNSKYPSGMVLTKENFMRMMLDLLERDQRAARILMWQLIKASDDTIGQEAMHRIGQAKDEVVSQYRVERLVRLLQKEKINRASFHLMEDIKEVFGSVTDFYAYDKGFDPEIINKTRGDIALKWSHRGADEMRWGILKPGHFKALIADLLQKDPLMARKLIISMLKISPKKEQKAVNARVRRIGGQKKLDEINALADKLMQMPYFTISPQLAEDMSRVLRRFGWYARQGKIYIPDNSKLEIKEADEVQFLYHLPKEKVTKGFKAARNRVLYILADLLEKNKSVFNQLEREAANAAMSVENRGGIDFTANKTPLEVKVDSRLRGNDNGIQFHLDPAQLAQLQNAPGFVPVIISIQPLAGGQAGITDLRHFLET